MAVVKRGEHGALVFDKDEVFAAPAMPLESVVDPTGAGDSFAGGFMGAVASTGDVSNRGLRRAAVVGSMMGSFAVQDFSVGGLMHLKRKHLRERFQEFVRLTAFDGFEF